MASIIIAGDTSGTVTLSAPAVAGTQSYTLPTAQPTANGQALTATTAGVMSWATPSASPGGSTTQIQYNNAGAFAGSANMTYNGTTVTLLAAGVPLFIASTNGNGLQLGWSNAAAATPQFYMGSPAADTLQFANGSAIESLRINSTANLVLKGGSAGADGVGITFPGTQVASTNVNCLDDYEEGTWTPNTNNAYNSPPTVTYTTQSGSYTKVGRMVTLAFVIEYATFVGGAGPLFFQGLPFTPAQITDPRFQGTVYLSGPNIPAFTVSVTVGYAKLDNGQYYNCFICSRDDLAIGNGGTINCADVSAGDVIAGTWTYFV